jgi:Serine dehydrogenase proteinase
MAFTDIFWAFLIFSALQPAIQKKMQEEPGLPVGTDVPVEIYRFVSHFPQPTRVQPPARYIPVPHPLPQPRAEKPEG